MLRIDSKGILQESDGVCTRLNRNDTDIIQSKSIKEEMELKVFNNFGDEIDPKWWVRLSDGELMIRPLPQGWTVCLG